MGIKSEFYLTVSLDTLRHIVSHIIPEGEIVDEKINYQLAYGNTWATRAGEFTTYVKDNVLYLAAPFHINIKFSNFFAHHILGEQVLEFTLTIQCSMVTDETMKITLNLNVFDFDWKAKPALPGGVTVAGHVEPYFRDFINKKLQEVEVLFNQAINFQAEVASILQKIQTPIKLQSLLIKSGSEGTIYYMHPNPTITITPIQITDAGFIFQAAVDIKITIDLNPLAPNNQVIIEPDSSLIVQMFNACQSGNLATVKALHQQGVPLSVKHPYNNVSLVHVACWPQINPSGNGWHNISHTELVGWLLEEMSKHPEDLLAIFNEQVKAGNAADKAKYASYHASTLNYDSYSGKSLKELSDGVCSYWYRQYVEISGQRANPFQGRDLAYGTQTYQSFNATKQIIDKYFAISKDIEKLPKAATSQPPLGHPIAQALKPQEHVARQVGALFKPPVGGQIAPGPLVLRAPAPRGAQAQRLVQDYGDHLRVALDIDARGKQSYTFYLLNRDRLGLVRGPRLQAEIRAEFDHWRGYTTRILFKP